ncbi:P-loop containing nucleoside triphosphate hydrolase protein [Cladochytrium replicatum]|nr:P-loop containing nucleoside triphosphate hydrolase protein [Cladochytrium replicatum]
MADGGENVLVVVRCRPFSEKEKQAGHRKIVTIVPETGTVSLENPKQADDIKSFTFDAAFDETCQQMEVYNGTARGIVEAALSGFNGTVFAYGQTGTGKTFSMQGVANVPHLRGIIPNAFNHIFDHIARSVDKKFLVRVSFLEIYNEEIRDLLTKQVKGQSPTKLDVKEHPEKGVYVKDLSAFVVKSVDEMDNLMTLGNNNRSVGATLMNENSSRSHSIFSITIECAETVNGEEHYFGGKLHLVDLAGSERQSKTGASGDRLKEATKINLSLSALGNCISALVDGKSSHIPYRDSKLTRLLQDSLGGNAKTLMIATMSPASYNFDETLGTLRYANRAKNIKNKPKINEDPKDALLRQYQEEIELLRKQLEARQNGGSIQAAPIIDAVIHNALAEMDPETIARLQEEVEAEKRALLASKDIVIEEKQRIAAELEKRAAELNNEREARGMLENQLKSLEAKLLIGGVNIVERVNAQEQELQNRQLALQEQRTKERELQNQLEMRQEAQLQMEENYASLQEEVDAKSKKLKKLWTKLQAVKSEISDLQDEFRHEREDLLDTVRELSRELSLKLTLIENFIPREEREKIERRATYDEEHDDWALAELTSLNLQNKVKRPVSTPTLKRPTSQYAKRAMMMGDTNPRYRGENILTLQLDMPERTTDDEEITVASSEFDSSMQDASKRKSQGVGKQKSRPKTRM